MVDVVVVAVSGTRAGAPGGHGRRHGSTVASGIDPEAIGSPPPATLYDLDRSGLAALLEGEPAYRVDQLWDGLYRQALPPAEVTNLPADLRRRLAASHPGALTEASRRSTDDGDTLKWLWSLADGARIETVLMHYPRRSTVCVSTQAGCAMGCGFCATGQAGFQRNLGVGEILEQVVAARREAARSHRRVDNVVFMGMGEPLANFERTWEAVGRLRTDMGLSARNLTISTVGIVPGIRRLASEATTVNLAVSLHAANDALRDELVPINRRYPLDDLTAACREWTASRNRRLTFEWAMIADTNDSDDDARQLAALARSLRAHVNLIPLNPTGGFPTRGTPPARVREFGRLLGDLGVNATVRANRGNEIDAACGQLSATTPVADPHTRGAPS